jgi:hypothetical protein
MTSATHIHPIEQPMAATDVASTVVTPASVERELEYRQLMRKWWYRRHRPADHDSLLPLAHPGAA